MITNTDAYVSLMKDRAAGRLPDMGCALRVAELIQQRQADLHADTPAPEILDVGCATGHFYRTFVKQGLCPKKYTGLEIDPGMVNAAREIWATELQKGAVEFINDDLERFPSTRKFDFVICVNAFMYFASAKKALQNLLQATRHHLIVRSYFTDANYRIVRAQTKQNHDKSAVEETDVFDESGNMLCYDFWNVYSFSYIEAVVSRIAPVARVEWVDDRNVLSSLEQERTLQLAKRGATEIWNGQEISYPFILPWKYLCISLTAAS